MDIAYAIIIISMSIFGALVPASIVMYVYLNECKRNDALRDENITVRTQLTAEIATLRAENSNLRSELAAKRR